MDPNIRRLIMALPVLALLAWAATVQAASAGDPSQGAAAASAQAPGAREGVK